MRLFVLLIVVGYIVLWLFVLAVYVIRTRRYKRPSGRLQAKCLIIVPCKDATPLLTECVQSILTQRADQYSVIFVFGSATDSGLPVVQAAIEPYAHIATVMVNDSQALHSSQKIHNQLYALQAAEQNPPDLLVFADSDVLYPADWLETLCLPLTTSSGVVTTGIFWLSPAVGIWSKSLAWVYNTLVVPSFANPWINYLWGGGMAIRYQDFCDLDMLTIWQTAFYDDLSLGAAAKAAGLKIQYIFEVVESPAVNLSFRQCVNWIERQMVVAKFTVPFYYWLICFLVIVPALILVSPLLALFNPVWWLVVLLFPFRALTGAVICLVENRPRDIAYIPFDYLGFVIGIVGVLKSVMANKVTWAGIEYEFLPDRRVRRVS